MIAACWKWIAPGGDERWAGVSESDRAALEVALRLAAAVRRRRSPWWRSAAPEAEAGLREALAVGAARAVRIDAPADLASEAVARALAAAVGAARWIVCGDVSADRGSGSVPAFVAAELGAAQALGLLSVTARRRRRASRAPARRRAPRGPRRDDAGRAVGRGLGGATAAGVAARRAGRPHAPSSTSCPGPGGPVEHPDAVQRYRPRARALAAPIGAPLARVLQLTDAVGSTSTTHELVTLDPAAAADRILGALDEWGYLTPAT